MMSRSATSPIRTVSRPGPLRRPSSSAFPSRPRCAATSPASRCSRARAARAAPAAGSARAAAVLSAVDAQTCLGARASCALRRPESGQAPSTTTRTRTPPSAALVFDATGIATAPSGCASCTTFFHPVIRRLQPERAACVVLGTPPEDCRGAARRRSPSARSRASPARSAKEVRNGSDGAARLRRPGAEGNIESTLRFLLSARKSAYVDGPGGPHRRRASRGPRRLGRAARRQGRAGDRRLARHRRVDRRRRSPATARTWSASTCPRRARSSPRWPTGSRARRSSSTSPTTTRRATLAEHLQRAPRRRRRGRPQRGRHPRQDARADETTSSGTCVLAINLSQPGAHQRRAARAATCCAPGAGSCPSRR